MVGLVVVSHSRRLAEGVVELAREMGGAEVNIVPAGGTDLPDDPLGTDAMKVMDAIQRAQGGDGVIVLMDLGSAVLSAEMAVEMLDEDAGPVLLCEAPLVEGAVAAASAARAGMTLVEVADEARAGLAGKIAHLEEPSEPPPAPSVPAGGGWTSVSLHVGNPLGLHARPAARFVRTASGFDAQVRVTNLTTGAGPASARSLNELATLGVRQGHDILVDASGSAAEDVLAALKDLAADGFGDAPAQPEPEIEPVAPGAVPAGALAGVPASPGVVVGPARHAMRVPIEISEEKLGTAEEEWRRLEGALRVARREIAADRDEVARRAGESEAGIFDAHEMMLEDASLIEGARAAIQDRGEAAPRAWADAVTKAADAFRALTDPYLRERAADVEDVGRRVQAHLAGIEGPALTLVGEGVLVAEDLSPADTVALDLDRIRGIATALGGPASHAAILSRALDLPAVVGVGPSVLDVQDGSTIAIDGAAGLVYVDPPEATLIELRKEDRD
jgi:dihydroxyacetone kinase phosphotransfer subunit